MTTSLTETAAQQGGAFTTQQALDAGFTRYAVAAEVRAGTWKVLTQGVFAETSRYEAMDPRAKHLCELRARLLALDGAWVAGRRTAAVVHGLPLLGPLPRRPQLVRPKRDGVGKASTRFERVATLAPRDIDRSAWAPATTVPRTVVDLLREEPFRAGVVVADAALRRGIAQEELLASLARQEGWPGAGRVMRVLDFASGLSESALESISRVVFHQSALPPPELQVKVCVGSRVVARVDNLWRAYNLVGEADGAAKYRASSDLHDEKLRQDELTDLGLAIVRWGWDETYYDRGRKAVAKVRRGLARGATTTVHRSVRFVPVTVAELLELDALRAA